MVTASLPTDIITDPLKFKELCWPDLSFYDKQVEILESIQHNSETVVPAGNGLGKDFIAGFIAVWFFCSRSPCRIVTSSVDGNQLEAVLWGEMRQFIQTSEVPLPIQYNHLHLRQLQTDGTLEPKSYVLGRVVKHEAGLLGHHLPRGPNGMPRTLVIIDEASAFKDESYRTSDTWAHRKLIIGNCYPCANFFYRSVTEGDLKARDNGHYIRKVIRIKAEQSPNVRLAEAQEAAGQEVTHETLIPGVVDKITYDERRLLWDPIRQSIGLDALFWEGAESKLYPPDWLDRAERVASLLKGRSRTMMRTMGVDVGEGGDDTVWTVVDLLGVLFQHAMKTPDTSVISGFTIQYMREWNVLPENTLFDRGGGGKQHADYLRRNPDYAKIKTVGFGESATDPKILSRSRTIRERGADKEQMYVYKNRRAEMFGLLRLLLDPVWNEEGFGIPAKYTELRRQLAPIPLQYDPEGRLYLPPKNKKPNSTSAEVTLVEMLGCSPDEADSLALAVFGQFGTHKKRKARAFA